MTNHYLDRSIPEPTIEEKIKALGDEDNDLASEHMNCEFEHNRINDILDKIDELKQFSYDVDGAYVQTECSGGRVEEEFVKSLLYSQRYAENKMKRIANRRGDIQKELYILNDQKIITEINESIKNKEENDIIFSEINESIKNKEENDNESTADNK